MFCPKCGAEYREGFTVCAKCDVPLVSDLPGQGKPEYIKFVTVYETGNPAIITFAKSVLKSEGIKYYFKGEGLQDLFAGGSIGTGFNPIIGPVQIQVDEKDVKRADQILSQIQESEFDQYKNNTELGDEEEVEEIIMDEPSGGTLKNLFKGVIIGILISGIGFFIYNYKQKHYSGVITYDLNKDSKPDLFYTYKNGIIIQDEQDRNFDGKSDVWYFYKNALLDEGESDDNFDGIVETSYFFKHGILTQIDIDTNVDDKPEIIEYYTNGIMDEKTWHYGSTMIIWRKALYSGGVKREEHIDQDYDGTFDIEIIYNSSERPIYTRSLSK